MMYRKAITLRHERIMGAIVVAAMMLVGMGGSRSQPVGGVKGGKADEGDQNPPTPREYLSVTLPKGMLRYALVLPDGYDAGKVYPVAIALPPGGQDERMVEAGLSRYFEREAKKRGWVVVSPINPPWAERFETPPGSGTSGPIAGLMDAIAYSVLVEGHVFHILGVSNGGRAAFTGALQAPGHVGSITVLPGMLEPDISMEKIKVLKDVPIAMFVGERDSTWVEGAKKTTARLEKAGAKPTLEIIPGSEHVVELAPERIFDLLETRRAARKPAKK